MPFRLLLLLTPLLAAGGLSAEEPKSIPLAQLPPAAQKAIQTQIGTGTLENITRADEPEEAVFDVTFTGKDETEHDFSVADDGTLISVEVQLAETPAAVQKTIQAQAPGWELKSIDKDLAEIRLCYDVEVAKGDLVRSFTVNENGSLSSLGLTLAETPPAVQATIKALLATDTLKAINESFETDGTTFDVDLEAKGGVRRSFSLGPEGRMLSQVVPLAELPPPVRKTILDKYGPGKILRVEKSLWEKDEGVLPYDIEGRKGGKPVYFTVGPNGRFLGWDEQ